MPSAHVRLVDGIHYRRDAFEQGLGGLGYEPTRQPEPKKGNVLVLWNRYARDEQIARAYEKAGGHVLITENAWLGPEEKDKHLFALCRGHHNGAGTWHVGEQKRFDWPVKPWRKDGDYILVLPQRGMGEVGVDLS